MELDKKKQEQAKKKAQQLIAKNEQKLVAQRVQRQARDFVQGNIKALLNNEFGINLSNLVAELSRKGDKQHLDEILEKLGDSACNEDLKIRERGVTVLSLCSSLLTDSEDWDLVERLTTLLVRWLRVETTYMTACDTVCRQLQENGLRMLQEGHWREASYLLETLFQIQSGFLEKSNTIRGVVSRTQDNLAVDYILEELSLICLKGKGPRQAMAEELLIHLGRKAAIFLLSKLLHCKEKNDRLRLIGLIPATGRVAMPVLEGFLAKDIPWYGKRNIILMIEAIGDPSYIHLIAPCLKFPDMRVQQQAIDSIYELGGPERKKHLLAALRYVMDDLKVHLVDILGRLGGDDLSHHFLDLLAERDQFSPQVKDALLGKLCVMLRLAPNKRTVNLLQSLVEEREQGVEPENDRVLTTAVQTLQLIEPGMKRQEKKKKKKKSVKKKDTRDEVSFTHDPAAQAHAKLNIRDLEAQVEKLLGEKQVEKAGEMLYEYGAESAREKDFVTAEMLRDRLLEVNPGALGEVIRLGEIIEAEKSSSIPGNHLKVWQDLYDKLGTEEFNALYETMEEEQFQPDETIVQQGEKDDRLFFINEGQVRLSCIQGESEIFLKRLGAGDVMGLGPFFSVSMWTVSLTASKNVKLHSLEYEHFRELVDRYPIIESTLLEFVTARDEIPELLKMSGEDRRQSVRHPVTIMVSNTLIDDYGQPSGKSFKGETADISSGGLSFYIRISRKENARHLLGRKLVTEFSGLKSKSFKRTGIIVGVKFQDYVDNDFSVHVQFARSIDQSALTPIVRQYGTTR
ncbi:MAG: cyclic nucleotide-binding domain-containing protein [Thermodesulfobacteriota bacterium]